MPPLDDPARLARGAACYRAHCVQCHGGPGVAPGPDGMSMQPLPGPLLDAEAKVAYRARLDELAADLAEAQEFNDLERAAMIDAEIDALVTELSRAVGLGGRDRRAASAAERARLNVTRALRSAIDRIAAAHTELGQHFRVTVRTGSYCVYQPDPAATPPWEL